MKKLLIITIMLILLSSLASAILNEDVWMSNPFDNTTRVTPIFFDIEGRFNGTELNSITNTTGKFLDGGGFNGDGITWTDASIDTANDFTMCLWVYGLIDNNLLQKIWGDGEGTPVSSGYDLFYDASGNLFDILASDGVGWTCLIQDAGTFTNITGNYWNQICVGKNSSVCWSIINNRSILSVADTGTVDGNDMEMGRRHTFGDYSMTATIDEFVLWNRSLTINEVSDHWNNGNGIARADFAAPPVSGDSINISTTLPTNNTQFSTVLLNLNTTVNSTEPFDCSIYVNSSFNQTQTEIVNSTDKFVGFNLSFGASIEGSFQYFFSCNNSQNETNSTPADFYIDNVDPTITQNVNMSFRHGYDSLFTNFTFADPFLFSYNVSVCGNETVNSSLNAQTSVLFDKYVNVTGCTPGNNTLTITISDGHTAKTIPAYDNVASPQTKSLLYSFDNGYVDIRPSDPSLYETPTTTKYDDRYDFVFTKKELPKLYEEFIIRSSGEIVIMDNDYYQGWLVMPQQNKWVDFESDGGNLVTTERISFNEVSVKVWGLKTKEFTFNSIGDLNVVEQNFTFYRYNVTENFVNPLLILEQSEYSMTLTYDTAFITSTSANLTVNNTFYSPTKTTYTGYDVYAINITASDYGSDYNMSHYWNFSTVGIQNNDTNSTTATNQSVTDIGIDNCGVFTQRAINFTLRNATSNALVTGTIDGFFSLWVSNASTVKLFNLSWTGGSAYGLCINPAWGSFFINAQLEYAATGFVTNTFYFDNTTINNQSVNYTFLLNDDSSSLINFTVIDENGDGVEDVFIHVYQYDLTTNNSVLGQILKTGLNGKTVGNLVLNTQRYIFQLFLDGELKLETSDIILTSSVQTFRINLLSDYFASYDVVQGVTCSITYNNATNNFTFVYADSSLSVDSACLRVERFTILGSTDISNTCLNTSSGTITATISSTGNETFVGHGVIDLDGNSFVCGNPVTVQTNEDYKTFGVTGIFLSMFVIIFLIGVGASHPVMAGFFMVFGIACMVILNFLYISWTNIIALIIITVLAFYRWNRR